jgi:hypothetical protein
MDTNKASTIDQDLEPILWMRDPDGHRNSPIICKIFKKPKVITIHDQYHYLCKKQGILVYGKVLTN